MQTVSRQRQYRRNKICLGRILPPAVAETSPTGNQQQPAAAPIDEIVNRLLLRDAEVARLHSADDQTLVAEQLLGLHRETVLELLDIVPALPEELVFRSAYDGRHLDSDLRIIVD